MKSDVIVQKEKGQIVKICRFRKEFEKELYIYKKNPDFAPKLLGHNKVNTLQIKYVEGSPVIDLIFPDFRKIATVFASLHNLEKKGDLVICLVDTNPRNIIFCSSEKKYYLIDFSEWEYDHAETDLIHFLLFWCSLYKKDRFGHAMKDFLNSYQKYNQINTLEWKLLVEETTEKFDHRRNKFNKSEKISNPDTATNRQLLISAV